MPSVYLSTTQDVLTIAQKLAKDLESKGFEVFLPPRNGDTDNNSVPRIVPHVAEAEAYLVMIGPKFKRTPELEREWVAILEQVPNLMAKRLIPLKVGAAKLPGFLASWQAARVPAPKQKKEWTEFVDRVSRALHPDTKIELTTLPKRVIKLRERRLNEIEAYARQLRALGM